MDASQQIDKYISTIPDWRGERLTQLRKLINQAAPNLVEVWKWNTAVWQLNTNVCAISAFKDHVKINFFSGAQLHDLNKIFNDGLNSKQHRSINFTEHDALDAKGIQNLVQQASELAKR